jgi:hypothetical protein
VVESGLLGFEGSSLSGETTLLTAQRGEIIHLAKMLSRVNRNKFQNSLYQKSFSTLEQTQCSIRPS